MRSRQTLRWGIVLGLLLGGCHSIKPEASIQGAPQACCTIADPQLENFKGCRIPRRNCKSRQGEKWWMRGSVECGPVDEANCEGGRCCNYQQQYDPDVGEPIDNWAPPGHDKPTNNVTDPNAKPQHTVPDPSEASPDEAATAPAEEPEAEAPAAEATEEATSTDDAAEASDAAHDDDGA